MSISLPNTASIADLKRPHSGILLSFLSYEGGEMCLIEN